jgi:hypothetical protein
MGNFQDEYVAEELCCTLQHLPEYGNHGLSSLHDIFLLPLKERCHTNQQQSNNNENHMKYLKC